MLQKRGIVTIRKVFSGGFVPGVIPWRTEGRTCDGFVYYLSGRAEYRFEGHRFEANPRNFFYLAKDSYYEIHISEKSEFVCVNFDFSDNGEKKSRSFEKVPPSIRNDFLRLLSIWRRKVPSAAAEGMSVLYGLYATALAAEEKAYVAGHGLFEDACHDIAEHYTDPALSVADVAARAGISEVHLRRIFRGQMDASPVQYIQYLRLEHAKDLLVDSNYRIEEVAYASGFADPYYFSRVFHRAVGMTPGVFRRQHGQNIVKI